MSVRGKVDAAFEEFREYLVHLIGDIHGVHSVVDDAKAAIGVHVPEEQPTQDGSTHTQSQEVPTVENSPANSAGDSVVTVAVGDGIGPAPAGEQTPPV